ncbi:hypothetical protein LTR85_004308 [Meristemomyces frigidus]|nr:hypothetical protein LTR85_004308 [Meristemomyces frigidus]
MDDSLLAKLAPELRNAIYELVLWELEGFTLFKKHSTRNYNGLTSTHNRKARGALALTRTCKEIRAESLLTFYAVNTFTLQPRLNTYYLGHPKHKVTLLYREFLDTCQQWLRRLPVLAAQGIGRLVIEMPGGDICFRERYVSSWWHDARLIEKQILHKFVDASKVFIRFDLNFRVFGGLVPHPYQRKFPNRDRPDTCHADIYQECGTLTLELPSANKTQARVEVEAAEHPGGNVEHPDSDSGAQNILKDPKEVGRPWEQHGANGRLQW